jgi:Ca-activated chloride channel family protein
VSYRPERGEDGYFLLLATPQIKASVEKRQAKTVVFVVDRSGSMSGEKMEQAREALKFVLNNLREGDTFNIVAYDSAVETFKPELEKFTDETRVEATAFVNGLFAGGTTNIDGALDRAFGMLRDDQRPAYVIFLTDGLPTFGETNEAKIVENAEHANKVRARVFSFGVGFDLNSRLLDKLSRSGHGQSQFVRPNEDIEDAVSSFYRWIEAPVMVDVSLAVEVEGADRADGDAVNRVYPKGKFDLFAGDQAVLVGRYRTSGSAKVTFRGAVGRDEQSFDFPAEFAKQTDDDTNAFVAKLWATRRVGEIIDEMDLHGKNDELVKELVDLATEHGILTPYTSFLADDSTDVRDLAEVQLRAAEQLDALSATDGEFGVNQRGGKDSYRLATAPATASAGFDAGRGGYDGGRGGYGGGAFGGGGGYSGDRGGRGGGMGRALSTEGRVQLATRGGRGITYYDAAANEQKLAENVITVGRKTFFDRGGRWVDSSVTVEDEKRAKSVERYSDEYFALITRYGKQAAAYLSIDQPVTVKLGGEVYSW